MKRLFILVFGALLSGVIMSQEPIDERPQRTPEEEAIKQTTRLVRELDIRDSTRIDTIYRMHLKYARIRQRGLTRAQNMERMQSIYSELKVLLTEKEFDRFMNHPVEQPRRPHGANRIAPTPLAAPIDVTPNKQEARTPNR